MHSRILRNWKLEKDEKDAMKNKCNNKPPGNDGLTKEFYLSFWEVCAISRYTIQRYTIIA